MTTSSASVESTREKFVHAFNNYARTVNEIVDAHRKHCADANAAFGQTFQEASGQAEGHLRIQEAYGALMKSGGVPDDLRAKAREAYQKFLLDVQTTWATADLAALPPWALAELGAALSTAAQLGAATAHG
jgi:hypothetical protein